MYIRSICSENWDDDDDDDDDDESLFVDPAIRPVTGNFWAS